MAYRTPARRAEESEPEETGPLLVVSASGAHGKRGFDGARGLDGRYDGDDGGRGGDGKAGDDGRPGGRIEVGLAPARGATDVVEVHGTLTTAEGTVAVDESIDFTRDAFVELASAGGKGGRGGDGGSGGDGASGSHGSDATRYSSGTSGGDGGDGGDAGEGASGGRGGDGGHVIVRTSERDTHLLMLVHTNVGAGPAGASGEHGAPGAGGAAGRGGSSYSWTETSTSTDANGNTTTTSHHSSGGNDGDAGRAGRPAHSQPRKGKKGSPGTSVIEVRADGGAVTRYASRYDLRLVGFEHENENDDGVYEPGERVFVRNIAIENVGGMPLPAHHDVVVELAQGPYATPELDPGGSPRRLVLPRGLGAGARHVFTEDKLAFVLGTQSPEGPSAPLVVEETLRLRASLPAARRVFKELDQGASEAHGRVVVRFPIEISPVVGLTSLSAGQVTKLRVVVRNVSKKAYGAAAEIARSIGVRVSLGYGELGASDVAYFHANGEQASLDAGVRTEIPLVDAESSIELEAKIGIVEGAVPYRSARVVVACELAPVDGKGPPRTVQLQELVVRVGRPLDAAEGDVLVLVNDRTTPEELSAWEAHASELGLRFSTWDVSLENGVAVLDAIASGARAFHTVVVLDNVMGTPTGDRHPSSLVEKDLAFALANRGTRLLFVGKGRKIADLVVPTGAGTNHRPSASSSRAEVLAAAGKLDVGEGSVTVSVETARMWPWDGASAEDLSSEAAGLSHALDARFPDRRFVVVPRFEGTTIGTRGPFRIVTTGTLEVRRTTAGAPAALRNLGGGEMDVHAAKAVRSRAVFFVLLLTLPFEVKLRLLTSTTTPFEDDDDPFVLAVLADLVAESAPWMVSTFRTAELEGEGARALPCMAALRGALAKAPEGEAATRRAASLLGWLRFVARARIRWWEWIPPLVWLTRSHQLRRQVATLTEATARSLPRGEEGPRATFDELRARRANKPEMSGLVFVDDVLAKAGASLVKKSDADVLVRGDRVIEGAAFDDLVARDEAHSGRARAARERNTITRDGLLEPATCADLVARARARVRVAPTADPSHATASELSALLEDPAERHDESTRTRERG